MRIYWLAAPKNQICVASGASAKIQFVLSPQHLYADYPSPFSASVLVVSTGIPLLDLTSSSSVARQECEDFAPGRCSGATSRRRCQAGKSESTERKPNAHTQVSTPKNVCITQSPSSSNHLFCLGVFIWLHWRELSFCVRYCRRLRL
jgi:hypothetical protein